MTTLSAELAPEFWEQCGYTPEQINRGSIPVELFSKMRDFMHDHVAVEPVVVEQPLVVVPLAEAVA